MNQEKSLFQEKLCRRSVKFIGGEAEAEVKISFTKNHIVFEFDRLQWLYQD